jgi:HK97 family phage prohead protease
MISHRDFTSVEQKLDGRTLAGYSVVYGAESRDIFERGRQFREKIMPGAFDASIASGDVKLLYNHDPRFLLARTKSNTLALRSDSTGLHFSASLPETSLGNDVHTLLTRGDLTGEMSFGFHVTDETWDATKTQRTIKAAKLMEISIVQDAAYPQTASSLRSVSEASHDLASLRIKLHFHRMQQWTT